MKKLLILVIGGLALLANRMYAAQFCITPYLQRPAKDAMTVVFFTDSACTATVTCWPVDAAGTPRLRETTGEEATKLVAVAQKDDKATWGTAAEVRAARAAAVSSSCASTRRRRSSRNPMRFSSR